MRTFEMRRCCLAWGDYEKRHLKVYLTSYILYVPYVKNMFTNTPGRPEGICGSDPGLATRTPTPRLYRAYGVPMRAYGLICPPPQTLCTHNTQETLKRYKNTKCAE
jgi:hypothetical protein